MQQLPQQQPSSYSSAAFVESHHHLNGAEGSGAHPGPDSSISSSGGDGDGSADSPDQLELHVEAVVSTLSRVTESVADVLKSLHLVTAQLDVIANKLCSQCAAASLDGGDAALTLSGGVRRTWRPTMSDRSSVAEAGGGTRGWRLPSYAASESAGGNGGCCSGDEGESGYGGEGDPPRLSYPSESHSDDCGGSGGGNVGGYCDDDKLSDSIGGVVAPPVSSPQCGGSRGGGAQALTGGEPQPRSVSAQGLDEPHELDWDVNGLELSSSSPPPHDGYGRGGVGSEGGGCDGRRTDASDVDAAPSAAAAYRDVPQQRLSHSFTSPAFSSSYDSLSDSGGGVGGDRGGAYEFKVVLLQSLSEHDGWCRSDVHRPLGSSCRRRQPLPIAAPLYGSAYETQMESALESSALRSDTPSTDDGGDYDKDEMRSGAVHDDGSAAVYDDDDENEEGCCCVAGGAEVAAACGGYDKRRDRSSPPSEPVTFRMGSATSVSDDDTDARGSSAEVESTDLTTAVTLADVQPVGQGLDAGGARWASYDRDVNTWQSFTLAHSDDTSDGRATPGGAGSSAASTPRPLRSAASGAPHRAPPVATTPPLSSLQTPETAIRSAGLPATESPCPANHGQRNRELPAKLSALTGRLRERRRVRMSERQPVFV